MTDSVPTIAVHIAFRGATVAVAASGSPAVLVGAGVAVGVVAIGLGVRAYLARRSTAVARRA